MPQHSLPRWGNAEKGSNCLSLQEGEHNTQHCPREILNKMPFHQNTRMSFSVFHKFQQASSTKLPTSHSARRVESYLPGINQARGIWDGKGRAVRHMACPRSFGETPTPHIFCVPILTREQYAWPFISIICARHAPYSENKSKHQSGGQSCI